MMPSLPKNMAAEVISLELDSILPELFEKDYRSLPHLVKVLLE